MSNRVVKNEAEWRAALTREQFEVTRRKGTEPPFSGVYHDCKEPGTYRCVCCGAVLFRSGEKFDSGSGWPSFTAPAAGDAVRTEVDSSHGMTRTEVICRACDAHLGHVFDDGPGPGGQRFCINSAALKLETE